MLKGIGAILTLGLLVFVVFWFSKSGAVDNERNIEFIKSKMYNGELIDMQNEVKVNGVDDIKWYFEDNNKFITIDFGKIRLKYEVSEFIKGETQKALNEIGITVKQEKKTRKWKLYYQGEELTEYVKR